MKLRGIDFGCVLDASGTEGFFGEGYPYQKALGINFSGATFVAKTMTMRPRAGNMRMRRDGSLPWWPLKPDCIVVKLRKGVALNAVGLSNPGAESLLAQGKWQKRKDPFFLSFMAISATKEERMKELEEFVELLLLHKNYYRFSHFGLQINMSCPNVGLHPERLVKEAVSVLKAVSILDIPIMLKFNILLPVEAALKISKHSACDALCVSNTIPWGALPSLINWQELFGSDESPLKKYGGGGLSGTPLLPLVERWVKSARFAGITKPINAGGGILHPDDVGTLFEAGADSVFVGSVSFLRPWRVRAIIKRARQIYGYNQPK